MTNQDTYSRLIGWLKIALPLAALAILSTLFLVARNINPDDAIPYANVDVEERLREPRMTDPTYAGVTEDGASLSLAASEARPEAQSGSGTAAKLSGLLETPDGGRTQLAAASARLDDAKRQIALSGGVTIASSSGWKVESETLTAQMDKTDISTQSPVTATGPAGTVTAKTMQLTADSTRPGSYLLVFNGAVKLIYQPAN
jgi:lipopolysaccharide export system protein LptC